MEDKKVIVTKIWSGAENVGTVKTKGLYHKPYGGF